MDGDLGGVDITSGEEEATDGKSFLLLKKKKKKKRERRWKGAVQVQKEIITYRLMNERKKMERSMG